MKTFFLIFFSLSISLILYSQESKKKTINKNTKVFPCPTLRTGGGGHGIGVSMLHESAINAYCDTCKTDISYRIKSYRILVVKKNGDSIVFRNIGSRFQNKFCTYRNQNYKQIDKFIFYDFLIYVNRRKINCNISKEIVAF